METKKPSVLVAENYPQISVIVIVKNGERYLAQGLRSILSQTLRPLEIIVVDDHSDDKSADIARSFADVTYLPQASQGGIANSRNLGIESAKGDLIAFLDHDDLWAAEKLAIQASIMRDHDEIQYSTTLMRKFVENEAGVVQMKPGDDFDSPQEAVTPSSLLARKAVFATVGKFDPAYIIGCDSDWFLRARDLAVPCILIPQVLLYKRLHDSNISRNGNLNKKELFLIARASIERKKHR